MSAGKMSRRKFLGRTAAVGAGVTIAPSTIFGTSARAAPNDRILAAGIGMGGQGSGDFRNLLGFRDTQGVASCDVKKDAREGMKNWINRKNGNNDCAAYVDFRKILERDEIDVVLIGTPDHWHAIIGIMACKAGKDVFCEKPLTLTVREGREMVNATRRYGRVFSSGSQRVMGDYGQLDKQVRGGAVGKIQECWVNIGGSPRDCHLPYDAAGEGNIDWDLWLGPAPWAPYHRFRCGRSYGLGGKGFRTWRDYSGGMMTDWGGHKFGAAMFAMGLESTGPVEVLPPGNGNQYLTYVFANGIRLYHSPGKGDITVKGTNGEATRRTRLEVPSNFKMPNYKAGGGIRGDFLHCVKTRERPFRDVEFGHRTATICHLGNIMYQIRRKIKFDPVKERVIGDDEADRMLDRPKRAPWRY